MSTIEGTMPQPERLVGSMEYGLIRVVDSDYETMVNKPKINGIELDGNITSEELGVLDVRDGITADMVDMLWDAVFN